VGSCYTITSVYDNVQIYKVKVKLSLWFFLTEHHTTKAYWGVEV
jgi:hypothetical protein